ncbi:hypothetical protein B0T10DRAFT_411337 [Thelonectria olida]|uniref:C2H2-type domain-containing protein n=1 Tax=Thelonectria olida TaxID=1576542 RepID=A0A9P9ALJ3_9HYPO|nr:hypothetical protein B0T10DRAFT_411337 [Thelonectria olida]
MVLQLCQGGVRPVLPHDARWSKWILSVEEEERWEESSREVGGEVLIELSKAAGAESGALYPRGQAVRGGGEFASTNFTLPSLQTLHLPTRNAGRDGPDATPAKPHVCNTCGKRYTQPYELRVHYRTHTGEKPYACDTCGKRFTRLYNLNVHKRTHTGEKPYACDTCSREFIQSYELKVHYRTHTGEKPYACDTCGKRFSQKAI